MQKINEEMVRTAFNKHVLWIGQRRNNDPQAEITDAEYRIACSMLNLDERDLLWKRISQLKADGKND